MAELTSWTALNDALRTATEAEARDLLQAERRGRRRPQYLLRIHMRMNKMRAERERLELLREVASPRPEAKRTRHQGNTVERVARTDPGYLKWAYHNVGFTKEQLQAIESAAESEGVEL